MLNCTDLECILHHHHYYAQLHHLTHGTHHIEDASTNDSDGPGDDIQSLLNETDSELSGLAHLDAPNESWYMIGGVLIAMFLVGVIIILLAVTISKLRKREEHSATGNDGVVHAADVVQLQHRTTTHQLNLGALHHNNSHSGSFPHHHHIERTMTANNINHNNNNHLANRGLVQIAATPASGLAATQMTIIPSAQLDHQQHVSAEPLAYRGQFLWQYPTPMQQYNNDQTNVQHLTEEQQRSQGLVRGLRKNLGGRWRRLVRRKPAPDMCGAIPAELKPQLKQIYVY